MACKRRTTLTKEDSNKEGLPKSSVWPRLSFAAVVAALSKADCLRQLKVVLNRVMEENCDLKACLSMLEAPFKSTLNVATNKVMEVEAHITQFKSTVLAQVETCGNGTPGRSCQETNALKVCIGGLPQAWEAVKEDFSERINFLNETLKLIKLNPNKIEMVDGSKSLP
ncbi:hypothetical protein GOP47_0031023, partial [Adiantum capillus-veneris]